MVVAGLVVLAALGFVVFRRPGQRHALLPDRRRGKLAQRQQLGDSRFRIEGKVVGGSVREAGSGQVAFNIESKGTVVSVRHPR